MSKHDVLVGGWMITWEAGRWFALRQAPFVKCWISVRGHKLVVRNASNRRCEVVVPSAVVERLKRLALSHKTSGATHEY